MKRQELQVAALENGTVIDHIPSSKIFEVINLLHLEKAEASITIGFNLKSKKMGTKGIIKVADKFFSDEELNQLSVITPNVTLRIIPDYEVTEKKTLRTPDELTHIVRCPNPKCITSNEPMKTRLHVVDKEAGLFQCHYCNKVLSIADAKLL